VAKLKQLLALRENITLKLIDSLKAVSTFDNDNLKGILDPLGQHSWSEV